MLNKYSAEYVLKSIGNSAFYGCSGLTNIAIPDSVTSIGDNAFYGCSKNLIIKTSNPYIINYCKEHDINWEN